LRELAEARARRADAAGEAAAEPVAPQDDKDEDAGFATMTMVEIYLAQGYRQQAIEALRRILDSEPERVDARQKLELLLLEQTQEAPVESAEPVAPPPTPPAPRAARPGESREERALRRAEDKARFAAWVEKIRKQGEPEP
jgi:hypothetical protein